MSVARSKVPYPETPSILLERDLRIADSGPTDEDALLALRWMTYSRFTDQRIFELYRQGKMKGTVTRLRRKRRPRRSARPHDGQEYRQRIMDPPRHARTPHLSDHLGDHVSQFLGNAASRPKDAKATPTTAIPLIAPTP